jgi:hypothetical protein
MTASQTLSYHYHAHAYALSGEFYRPIKQVINVQAGSSLPHGGGHGHRNVENFAIDQLVTFRRGYSHVSGSLDENKHHSSQTTSVLEELNILDVVTADRIVARISSDHDPAKREGHIIMVGSRFENLRINGCEVQVEIDNELFLKHKTYADLAKGVANLKKSGRIADESNGVVVCSLAKSVKVDCPGVEVDGHIVTVAQFGTIYFAEVMASHGTKSVCMMRLEVGSPVGARLMASGGGANGTPFP